MTRLFLFPGLQVPGGHSNKHFGEAGARKFEKIKKPHVLRGQKRS